MSKANPSRQLQDLYNYLFGAQSDAIPNIPGYIRYRESDNISRRWDIVAKELIDKVCENNESMRADAEDRLKNIRALKSLVSP